MRYRVMLLGVAVPALLFAQQPEQSLPRFRAGTNLVRVDAYVSRDNVALTDLMAEDFALFEDDKPQQIENLQLVTARLATPQTARTDPTNVRDMNQQAADAARVFTLFFDRFHVQLSGSYHARKPIVETLDRVIGPDDLVGVMTPDMAASSITYSRRTASIERAINDTWNWGKRDSAYETPQESSLRGCYPSDKDAPMVAELIARLREQQTLDALNALVLHLGGLRPERKFVMVFTEGWPLYRSNALLANLKDGRSPAPEPVGTDPRTGGLRRTDESEQGAPLQSLASCDRLRTMLAYSDHEFQFRELLQRANRANVSFYPIDARGLVVFDTPINWGVPPAVDQAWLRKRWDDLRVMASQTDGEAVLDASDVSAGMKKVFADVGSYYLLSYYSTNPKLDGRFRRIRVEVRRKDVEVRSRPGYLAPTEAEARAAGGETRPASPNAPPPTVTRALDAIAPARGNLPARIQAAGARNSIRTIVELDVATAKQAEWMTGGSLRLTIEPDRGSVASSTVAAQTMIVAIDPGQRSIVVAESDKPLAAGRYAIRAELTARNSRLPIQVTTFVTVPADAAVIGTGALASRRGPSTGLTYVPTADPRFRRTERLRVEVPIVGDAIAGVGRLLTREGQPTPLTVTFSTRTDGATQQQFGVADVTLAPLAEGEYVLELSLTKDARPEVVSYGFRIVP